MYFSRKFSTCCSCCWWWRCCYDVAIVVVVVEGMAPFINAGTFFCDTMHLTFSDSERKKQAQIQQQDKKRFIPQREVKEVNQTTFFFFVRLWVWVIGSLVRWLAGSRPGQERSRRRARGVSRSSFLPSCQDRSVSPPFPPLPPIPHPPVRSK